MLDIYFATSNKDKLKEAEDILGVEVKGVSLDIDEIQSLDPIEVALKKAEAYYAVVKKPVFIEDVSFFISAIGQLPGPYIDAFMKALGNNGILSLMVGKKNRSAVAQATVVFISGRGKVKVFIGKVKGTLAKKPKGEGFGWDPIFMPDGESKTFGEMTLAQKNKFSMRAKALKKFSRWLASDKIAV